MMAADLTVTHTFLNSDHVLDPSQYPSMDVTIKNNNGVWFLDDAGGFSVRVVISDDQTITADDPTMGTTSVGGLGAGQTTTVTVNFTEMLNGEPFNTDNQYWLGVIVDPYNSVAESNENNNISLADAVSTERDLPSPMNGTSVAARPLPIGSTVSDSIGHGGLGGTEWLDGRDIDTYAVNIAAGQSVAFDFDSTNNSSVNAYMRLYDSSWHLVGENDDQPAPGEGWSSDPFLWGTYQTGGTYYLVVSSAANHAADPRTFAGRVGGTTGPYTLSTIGLLAAPGQAQMVWWEDTGISHTDNITGDTEPEFDFTGTPGKVGQLLIDGNVVGTANDSGGGHYHVGVPTALRDGAHQVVTRMYDPATNYTGVPSQVLWIHIDTVRPATPAAPDLTAASDHGVSDTDNITNLNTPTFTGTAEANGQVRLYIDGDTITPAVTAPVAADGTYTITSPAQSDGVHSYKVAAIDVAGNMSYPQSPATTVTIDTVAPTLATPIAFGYDTAPHTLRLNFSEDVGQSLTVNDFAVLDRATNATVGLQLAYDATTRTATFNPSGAAPQTFAQGNYRAILSGAGVTDAAGNPVAGTPTLDFFFMPADANQDRAVDTLDFNALAANFGKSNRTFSQGDFNYDGVVDSIDFNTLAAQFGKTLAPPAMPSAIPSSRVQPSELFSARVIVDALRLGLPTDSVETER